MSTCAPATKDLEALKILCSSDQPALSLIRWIEIGSAIFGFRDVSGGGLRGSWEGKRGTAYRFVTWDEKMILDLSDLRELTNLADTLNKMGRQDSLLFTDNSTSEAAYSNAMAHLQVKRFLI